MTFLTLTGEIPDLLIDGIQDRGEFYAGQNIYVHRS